MPSLRRTTHATDGVEVTEIISTEIILCWHCGEEITEADAGPSIGLYYFHPTTNSSLCEPRYDGRYRYATPSEPPTITSPAAVGLQATIEAEHWHLIPGGLEFEDANGAFVHVHLSREMYDSLAERMATVYRDIDSGIREGHVWQ